MARAWAAGMARGGRTAHQAERCRGSIGQVRDACIAGGRRLVGLAAGEHTDGRVEADRGWVEVLGVDEVEGLPGRVEGRRVEHRLPKGESGRDVQLVRREPAEEKGEERREHVDVGGGDAVEGVEDEGVAPRRHRHR